MTVLADLCAEPLDMTHGVLLDLPGYGADGLDLPPQYISTENGDALLTEDGEPLLTMIVSQWRLAVELAVVTAANILPFRLGTSQLGGPRWSDITGEVQGLEWTRGGSPSQRPIAGELTFRLFNPDGRYSPWTSKFYGPGSMVRVVVGDGNRTIVQFCGLVQSWNEGSAGLYAYAWCDVVCWEAMAVLSEVNDAPVVAVGAGDTLTQRIDRNLDRAQWQFSRDISTTVPATFQSTTHATDVLTELYLVVDSVDVTMWSAKHGMLLFADRATGTGVTWELAVGDLNPDSLVTANDDERILSSVDLARVGGVSQTYTNAGLAARYQRRSINRTDLKTVAEGGNGDLLRVASGMLARARQTYRPVSLEVVGTQNADIAALIIESDLTDRLTLTYGEVTFVAYSMCGFTHALQVKSEGVHWVTTISLDIEADSGWYHGTPTPALVGTARVGQTRVGFV